MDALVDNLIEDEAERAGLLAKPTCFIIFGRPVSSMRYLQLSARTLWKLCRLLSKDNNYLSKQKVTIFIKTAWMLCQCLVIPFLCTGYVLSCLPYVTEDPQEIHDQIELIKNLKLTPDFIINIKCSDIDLVKRLSGLKQHPETGQLHNMNLWQQEEERLRRSKEQEMEDTDEDYEEVLSDVFAEHNPIYLLELDGNDPPEELYLVKLKMCIQKSSATDLFGGLTSEDLLRFMTSIRIVAPGFRWRRSRWGRICPVALKEGNIIQGETDLCVGFQDKLYILSCQDAYQKFIANPRRYLLPPMPRPPCKVCIIGSSQTGKSTMCSLLAQHYGAVVLDLEELIKPFLAKADQERFEKLRDITTPTVKSMRKKKARENTSACFPVLLIHHSYSYLLFSFMYAICYILKSRTCTMESRKSTMHTGKAFNIYLSCRQYLLLFFKFTKYIHIFSFLINPLMHHFSFNLSMLFLIDVQYYFYYVVNFAFKYISIKVFMSQIETMNSNSEDKTGWVLDNFPKNLSEMDVVQQVGTLPDTIICLKDTDKHYSGGILRRIYEQNKESVDKEIEKRLQNQPFLRSETLL
uniref:Uncharacterized protein n=1 Tax=Poecilia latipinna TaxID=48699 RepID=A0A3B3UJ84_9TELE